MPPSPPFGYSYARPFARDWIGNELIADIAAGAAIFVVSMIVLTFISHAIAGGVRDGSFGMLDRSFGLLAGLAIGGIFVCGGYLFSQQIMEMTDQSSFWLRQNVAPGETRRHGMASAAPDDWA